MTDFAYDIKYDPLLGCYVWWYNGAGMCLGAESLQEAQEEVSMHIDNGDFPEDFENAIYDDTVDWEYEEDSTQVDSEVLSSAGYGTDEDYGTYEE